jgi:hypothetical protein
MVPSGFHSQNRAQKMPLEKLRKCLILLMEAPGIESGVSEAPLDEITSRFSERALSMGWAL